MKQRIIALLCVLALWLTLLPVGVAASSVYFTAVNDNLLPLETATMPRWIDGTLYVPYTVVDGSDSDLDMGIISIYNRYSGILNLYSDGQALSFNLKENTCMDHKSQDYLDVNAVLVGDVVFIPISAICAFFHLSYSVRSTEYGILVRITNDDASLADTVFIDAAAFLMSVRLKEYEDSLPKEPDPVIPPPPMPPGPPEPDPPAPPQVDVDDPKQEDTPLFLGILAENGDASGEILGHLQGSGQSAVFFFTPQALADEGDLIRQLLGSGQFIGLDVRNLDESEAAIQLDSANRLIFSIARSRTAIALADEPIRPTLEEYGYVCWQETYTQEGHTVEEVKQLLGTIPALPQGKNPVYLIVTASSPMVEDWRLTIQTLNKKQFTITAPWETKL